MAVFLMMLAGLIEGVGVMSLLPLLEYGLRSGAPPSELAAVLGRILSSIGIRPSFGVFLVVTLAGVSGKALLSLLAAKEIGYAVAGVMTDLRIQLLTGVFRARWTYLSSIESGRMANSVGIEALRAAYVFNAIAQLFALLIQVLIYVAVVALVSWQIAVAGLICSAFASLLLQRYVRLTKIAGKTQTELLTQLSNRVTEMLLSVKPVKAMGREEPLIAILVQDVQSLNRTQRGQTWAAEVIRVLQEPIAVAILAGGMYVFVVLRNLPLSSMMVVALLFYRLLGRLGSIQQTYQIVVAGESAYWSLKTVIDKALSEREIDHQGDCGVEFQSRISFSHVAFSYGETPVVIDASFDLAFGEYICIRGESGVGKSTLGNLLLRLIDPIAGEILIDGQPLKRLRIASWRSQLGYVPQEPGLFGGTIFENVTLGDVSLTDEGVKGALELAGALGFVLAMPHEIHARLDDRGANLSGGQRQRIAIARALVRRPKLLILDEITSSLDPVAEAAIVETLKGLRGKVTILAISHQKAMSDAADRELLMVNGRVVDVANGGNQAMTRQTALA